MNGKGLMVLRKKMKSEKVNFGRRKVFTLSVLFAALIFAIVSIGCASADLNDGLIAYYPFNGNANDESGNGNHGTVDGATLTTDRSGNNNRAYSFDGVTNIITVAHNDILNPKYLTISAWIIFDEKPTWCPPRVVSKFNYAKKQGYVFSSNDPNNIALDFFGIDGNYYDSTANSILEKNNWIFVAATYDGNVMKIYQNGQLESSTNVGIDIRPDDEELSIGNGHDGYKYCPWQGIIDDVRIYNRPLTETEIKELYNLYDGSDVVTPKKGLVGYWKFDEGSGTTAYDSSGYGNDGTIQGATRVDNGGCRKALNFDGDDHVDCGKDPSLDITDAFTIEAWVNFAETPPQVQWEGPTIVSKDEGGGVNNKWIFEYRNGRTVFHIGPHSPICRMSSNEWTPTPNQWYHLAVVKSGNTYTFYRNGVLDGTDSTTMYVPIINAPLEIGRAEGTCYFKGIIDEVRIYNYARSPSQILEDKNACRPGDTLVKKPDLEPYVCTDPDPPSHDFGSVPNGQTRE
jgi:hypothetical protein